jgi:hypothetical protein
VSARADCQREELEAPFRSSCDVRFSLPLAAVRVALRQANMSFSNFLGPRGHY